MKVVIVGDGKVGFTLADQLAKEGHDVVVIDKNKAVLNQLSEQLDVMVIPGNGASLTVQREAGVGESDVLIAATSADEINLLCCILGRKLGCKHTIARVRNPEYAEHMYFLKDELGLSMTINPELAAAREIFRLLRFPSFLKRESFAKGRVEIVEIDLKPGNPLVGKSLMQLQQVIGVRVLVCAVQRQEEVHIPTGSFVLQEGDQIYVTASSGNLLHLVRSLNLIRLRVRNVLLVGGSRIAHYLGLMLTESGISVKIIEMQQHRCEELCELLPKATVVCGDGTDKQVLLSEGIEQMDAVVSLTDMDEENLLVSTYARHLQVPKVLTKINRMEYIDVYREMGIGSAISPKLLCATDIVRYVRAMQNTTGGAVLAIHYLVDGQVEALEFTVTKGTKYLGQTLTQITLKPDLLIACINRRGTVIIPKGSDTLEQGDTVIVVSKGSHTIYDLNDIFA